MSRIGLRLSVGSLTLLLALVSQGADTLEAGVESPLRPSSRWFGGEPDHRCAGCNVFLISIDTLRADHVGAFGYERETTPNVDKFALESVLFNTAVAHAASTLPSHASIFTSLIPAHHKASHSRDLPLPQDAVTMAEILWQAGFRTAAFTAGAQLDEKYAVDQGFDLYHAEKNSATHRTRFSETVALAETWIDEHLDEQIFVFLHTYEVHAPYTPRRDYLQMLRGDYGGWIEDDVTVLALKNMNDQMIHLSEADRNHIISTYDAEIRNVDDAFAGFLAFLRDRGLYDNSLIVFTSDHGEEFGERGKMGWHAYTLYDELLRVPLIIRFPRSAFAGAEVHEVARGIDILPTITDVLGIEPEVWFEGLSLVEHLEGRKRDVVFAVSQRDRREERPPTAIRTKRWKLIDGALFDLARDPMERVNVANQHPYMVAALDINRQRLLKAGGLIAAEPIELSEELRRQLRALGYIEQ